MTRLPLTKAGLDHCENQGVALKNKRDVSPDPYHDEVMREQPSMKPQGACGWICITAALALILPINAHELDEPGTSESAGRSQMPLNIPTWTLGGKQFWTDELIHGQWRIQRNVLSGHCRLLDPANVRRIWGSWDTCLRTWTRLKQEKKVEPLGEKVVIVLHGLGRTRSSVKNMAQYLAENSDYCVLSFSYASTRATIAEDAKSLAKVISHLEGVKEINFVAHSMGNLVVRHLLGDQRVAADGQGVDHRLGRIVMLAPPNNGAALADRFKGNPVFKLVFGSGGQQFTKQWDALQKHLITPPRPFGIIAGGAKDGEGRNPLLDGNDDMVVTVQETRLPGADDFVVLPVSHTFIMDDTTAQAYTLRFLQHGYFISQYRRQPIEKD